MGNHTSITAKRKLTPHDVRDAIQTLCDEANYNPFKDMIAIAQGVKTMELDGKTVLMPEISPELRFQVAKEIASYLAPKVKQIEVQGQIDHDYTFVVKHVAIDSKPPELRHVGESPALAATERNGRH